MSAGSNIRITVDYTSNPEPVTTRNTRSRRLVVRRAVLTYRPRPGEPCTINRCLGSGRSVTVGFRNVLGPRKLTQQSAFHDTQPNGKAEVVLNVGSLGRRCS